jgi:hypothetical protein
MSHFHDCAGIETDYRGAAWSRSWTHDRKVVGSIPVIAMFACNPEQVALLRLLSPFE